MQTSEVQLIQVAADCSEKVKEQLPLHIQLFMALKATPVQVSSMISGNDLEKGTCNSQIAADCSSHKRATWPLQKTEEDRKPSYWLLTVWGKSSILLLFCLMLCGVSGWLYEVHEEGNHKRRLQTVQIVNMSVSEESSCRGHPSFGWGSFGKNLHPDACQRKCLADESCEFVVYRHKNGACTKFASCNDTRVATGFTIFAKQKTLLDFGPTLSNIAKSCTRTAARAPFKVLGCRGNDSRCAAYSSPSAANEKSCKALRRGGAACTWAKEDPSGTCMGHDSRCGQDSYKTEWRCKQLQKSGASCRWRKTNKNAEADIDSTKMKGNVNALLEQLKSYIPLLHANSTSLMSLLEGSTSEAICMDRVGKIGASIGAYTNATEKLQLALNPQAPVEKPQSSLGGALDSEVNVQVNQIGGAPDTEVNAQASQTGGALDSEVNVQASQIGGALDNGVNAQASHTQGQRENFAKFRENYAPKVFGCTGHHSQCAAQPSANACKRAGGDCSWATTQKSGKCQGNDSRCATMPIQYWKEGCEALQAQHASCSWVSTPDYTNDLAHLTEKLQVFASVSASDLDHMLSTNFDQRLSSIASSFAAVEDALSSLNLAVGMIN
mmetsp:Transcript_28594/g.53619  ORF Transcript_28594/g.53619 Transcript_28594/m.53619 type:complete len:608 (+) Transcript_28594:69-1892(+)